MERVPPQRRELFFDPFRRTLLPAWGHRHHFFITSPSTSEEALRPRPSRPPIPRQRRASACAASAAAGPSSMRCARPATVARWVKAPATLQHRKRIKGLRWAFAVSLRAFRQRALRGALQPTYCLALRSGARRRLTAAAAGTGHAAGASADPPSKRRARDPAASRCGAKLSSHTLPMRGRQARPPPPPPLVEGLRLLSAADNNVLLPVSLDLPRRRASVLGCRHQSLRYVCYDTPLR